jgi:hypothetical protein
MHDGSYRDKADASRKLASDAWEMILEEFLSWLEAD